jgi:nitrite reductase (cytochrome c-552)
MSLKDVLTKKPWIGWLIFFVTLVIVFLIGLFGSSIVERRSEAIQRFQIVKEIPEW